LGATLEAHHKLQPKPKTSLELKVALQRIWTALPQKSIAESMKDFCKRLEACMSANAGHFEHKI